METPSPTAWPTLRLELPGPAGRTAPSVQQWEYQDCVVRLEVGRF